MTNAERIADLKEALASIDAQVDSTPETDPEYPALVEQMCYLLDKLETLNAL